MTFFARRLVTPAPSGMSGYIWVSRAHDRDQLAAMTSALHLRERLFFISACLALAIMGTARTGILGLPINTAYYDHLIFSGILDNARLFEGTLLLAIAEKVSSVTLATPVARYLNHAGLSYVAQAWLVSLLLINFVGCCGAMRLTYSLSRNHICSLLSVLVVFDTSFLFQIHLVSSSVARSFSLLAIALSMEGRYRACGAVLGLTSIFHPIYPPLFVTLCAIITWQRDESWKRGIVQLAMFYFIFSLPALVKITGHIGLVQASPVAADQWVSFMRTVNQLPFAAMNQQKFMVSLVSCVFLGVFFLIAGTLRRERAYFVLTGVSLFSFACLLTQGFGDWANIPFLVKLALHIRVLPLWYIVVLIGCLSIAYQGLRQGKAFFPLWIGPMLYLISMSNKEPDGENSNVVFVAAGCLLLLCLEWLWREVKESAPLAGRGRGWRRYLPGTASWGGWAGKTLPVMLLLYALYGIGGFTAVQTSWQMWKNYLSGTTQKAKGEFRNIVLSHVGEDERIFIAPLRLYLAKWFSMAPDRASFLEYVEPVYLLYSSDSNDMDYVKKRIGVYGEVNWESSDVIARAGQYNDATFDGWSWRSHVKDITRIDSKTRYVITIIEYTCKDEKLLLRLPVSANRNLDVVLIRISDVVPLKSCQRWTL